MSPSHTYTVGPAPPVQDDDDENDICPVCDGDCTCHKPHQIHQQQHQQLVRPVASTPSAPHASIKIKLTLPPSMLGKGAGAGARLPLPNFKKYKNISQETNPADSGSIPAIAAAKDSAAGSKRRGRPPKATSPRAVAPVDQDQGYGNAAATLPSSIPPRAQERTNTTRKSKIKSTATTKNKGKTTTVKKTVSAPKRARTRVLSEDDENFSIDEDDEDDGRSVQFPTFVSASAMSTTSDGSSSSAFDTDTDSSIEAEEEAHILEEESRRVHDRARVRRELLGTEGGSRPHHNDWIIRPRKKSVGPSDAEMDGDSDATEEDEEEEEEEEEGEGDEEETDGRGLGAGYAGVATGWSEDEESSFDADLFFANLSDSTAHDDSSSSSEAGEDGYQTDVETMSAAAAGDCPPVFDVSQGWDGQLVFTNGLREGEGAFDVAFEANAAQLVAECAPPSVDQDSDVEMAGSDREDEDDDVDRDYPVDLDESDGATTEDELVGEDGLPTQQAMLLFRWPSTVSAIDPLSTVSPVSPRRRASTIIGSPNPADILAGRVPYWDDSDEHDRDVPAQERSTSARGGPVMGAFVPEGERVAILDGKDKDVPSPYPRSRRNGARHRSGSRNGSHSEMDVFTGSHLSRSSSLSVPSASEDISQTADTGAIDLSDVLDASFLTSEPFDTHALSSTSSETETHRHLQSLSRWERIPMGMFRRTRESGAEDVGAAMGVMRTSPFSTMIGHKRTGKKPAVIISPVLLPIRERDGDRTPTSSQKTRKETRRERKMKRKSHGSVHHQHQHHQHQHHHFHQHHPNMKSRSTSAMQRSNFFTAAAAVPPTLNL